MNKFRADCPDPPQPDLPMSRSDGCEGAETVEKSLFDHGCALIRGHVDPAAIDRLFSAARKIYRHRDKLAEEGRLSDEKKTRHTEKGIVDLADLPGGPDGLMVALHTTIIWPVASRVLGHEPQFSGQDFVRRISPGAGAWRLPYHQDESVLNRPLVNVWIPLHDCDDRHARIEVISSGSKSLIPPSPRKAARFAAGRAEIDPEMVKRNRPDGTAWSPRFAKGDVLMFLGSTIHRTSVGGHLKNPRYSIEFRLV